MRWIVALLGCLVALACAVGFVATYEPLERGTRLAWRAAYGSGGALALVFSAWALFRGRRVSESARNDRQD